MNTFLNDDVNNHLPNYPNNYFDFGVFDGPYAIGEDGTKNDTRGLLAKVTNYKHRGWDDQPPSLETFAEITRVCRTWLIFGANYYQPLGIPFKTPRREQFEAWRQNNPYGWIAWDKDNGKTDFNDFELALSNLTFPTQRVKFKWQGMLQGDMKNKQKRIHATEKPIPLYSWIFRNFTTPGMRVIDGYLGSGASAIAAHYAGLEFTGIEKHPGIFKDCMKRYNTITKQTKLL
jgi:site-specific DNA-methyltransferase (adenine-specific)